MKLTVLGNRSPFPVKDGGCPSYLLESDNQKILIDIGPDSLQELNKHINYYDLTAIVISHLHGDHFQDLLPLHYAIMLDIMAGRRKEALAVYLPFDEGQELDFIRSKVGKEYHLQPIDESIKLSFGNLNFSFKRTKHPKECYGMRISNGTKILGYTADTGWDESLISFLSSTDLLMVESSLLEQDKDKTKLGHLTVKEAVNFGVQAKTKQLLLTHLGAYYPREEIEAEVEQVDIPVEISRVGVSYQV
ncbi:ribonuclease BN (tRNA processing enzyme) [Orenia metallireducens]|jgi:ribonuclease BN (tRNA processing enzyme)|uniref:Ribonuclease BN, tRNA processing enzyme n=1 Tax=Orenia metallireducens TaxID=1413210 RepID=A0A285HA85_9FIRM|nr:MBL fold metallo-hydrolase [Orenia metallireducens]PRX28911.1 ribonuclease BN (tRNA processing enzyme) [Orenia metallireducens]SNY32483.1 Ribonuclease BN, tRNA processing enzyme [Orenia metallireducens]